MARASSASTLATTGWTGEAGVRAEDILISVVENGVEDWYAGRL